MIGARPLHCHQVAFTKRVEDPTMTIRHRRALSGAFAAALMCFAANVAAQVPGIPVLQNAFSNPGLAVAANFGSGSGQSYYGVAAAWGMGSEGALSISGAAGAQRGNDATRGAYGARVAARIWSSSGGALGAGGFVGLGGAPRTRTDGIVTNPAVMTIPIGVSVGYRRALGRTRGISAYLSPFYRWVRTASDSVVSSGALRVSGGVDFSFSSSLGVTVGGDVGGAGKSNGASKSSSGALGVAISFVPGGGR